MPETTSTRGDVPVTSGPAGPAGADRVALTVLGGPTVVLDVGGARLIVDPTFDPPGEYPIAGRRLVKTARSAWEPGQVGEVAAVLLSHDQHPDNLDNGGRAFLATAPRVLTTTVAAGRLAGAAVGLRPWETVPLGLPGGGRLSVTAAPARHGPAGTEQLTGPVIGFVLTGDELPVIYISGDNASLDIVGSVAERFGPVDIAVLFAGGAKTALLGDDYLTLSSAMAAQAVRILGMPSTIVVHADGWAHFTEPYATVPAAFEAEGVAGFLVPTAPGETVAFGWRDGWRRVDDR